MLGRFYSPSEYAVLGSGKIVISSSFWKNKLQGDPNVIGRVIHLEEEANTIIGVAPPLPDLLPDVDVYPTLTTRPSCHT